MNRGWFITGTDTGVGKTFVTAGLVTAWRSLGLSALGLKPIACGDRGDAEALSRANEESLSLNQINPVFTATPLAPYAASILEDRIIDDAPFWDLWPTLQRAHPGPFLIEGAGGWLVPITRQKTMRDFARALGFPVLVVARAGLGTLNHSLLTVESIRAAGLDVVGIVLNHHGQPDDLASNTNGAILNELAECPVHEIAVNDAMASSDLPSWLIPEEGNPCG